jgi:hypothetical protein
MEQTKRKRGRPPKHGVKDGSVFRRVLAVLDLYDKLRRDGNKYSSTITGVVASLHERGIWISETEVRRIVTEFRPRNAPLTLLTDSYILDQNQAEPVHKILRELPGNAASKEQATPISDPLKPIRCYPIRFGKPPVYPRAKANKSPEQTQ